MSLQETEHGYHQLPPPVGLAVFENEYRHGLVFAAPDGGEEVRQTTAKVKWRCGNQATRVKILGTSQIQGFL